MALQFTGQPQNVQITQGGNDIASGNPLPVSVTTGTAGTPGAVRLSDGSAFYDAAKTGQLPTALGQQTMAASVSVAIASNQSAIRTNSEPASSAAAVSLASDFTPAFSVRGVWVGTGGTLKVDLATGTGISFPNVQDGTLLPIQATKIYSTANGTSASNIVVLG